MFSSLRAWAVDGGLPKRLTPAEVAASLQALSADADEIARALALARFHSRGLRHLGPEDLLQEAFTKLYTGERSWPRGLPALQVLGKAMHSISSNERRKADYMLADDLERAYPMSEPRPVDAARAEADPARVAEAESELDRLRHALWDDPDAQLLLEMWADGLRGKRAMRELGWSALRHDATRKRLLRRLAAGAPTRNKT